MDAMIHSKAWGRKALGTERFREGLRDAEIHRKTQGRKDLGTQRSTEGLRNAKIWGGRDLQDWPRTKQIGEAKIYRTT